MLLFICSCSGAIVQKTFTPAENKTIKELLTILSSENEKIPETLSAQVDIEGMRSDKKYKSIGKILFDTKNDQMNITFFDFIFKSPLTMFIKNANSLSLYYPAEKKLILSTTERINFKSISGIPLDMKDLIEISVGKIPLITKYRVKQVLSSDKENRVYLVLENPVLYETISFKDNRPDRILFIEKTQQVKVEFYINKWYTKRGCHYYKNVRVYSESRKFDLEITFSRIKINEPVAIKTEKDISMPKDVRVINQ